MRSARSFVVILIGFLSLSACSAPIPPIELADVTPVWPLVTVTDRDASGFLSASTSAGHGVVFPRDVFDSVPALTRTDEPDDIYGNLIVVGARLDPCFQEGFDVPCEASVRLVLQPILPKPDDADVDDARDGSIHAFYVVEDTREIFDAIADLARLRASAKLDASGRLDVNPLLASDEGRTAARDVILPLIGGERLVRITSMQLHAGNQAWTFSGFAISELGTFTNPDQVFAQHVLSVGEKGPLDASVDPPYDEGDPDDYSLLLNAAAADAATLDQRQAAFDAAARIENPALNNSGTRDCVSCHLTAIARASALAREPLVDGPDAFTSDRYDLSTPTDFENTELVHNLGYRFDVLTLSPRLIHETAVAAALADHVLHP
jgi:hypothetical protein